MEKMRLNFWLMALRPKTLGAAVVPVVVGTLLAYRFGHQVRWWLSAWALLSTLFIQIGTNLFNDVIDFRKGADTNQRLGPQRVTQSGAIAPTWVFGAGVFSFLLATACGMPLVFQGGPVVVGIGILSLFFGYAYTGGPYPSLTRG
jgi:1,4-dihydroxy-2-naphthoate octaprenyltransferase